MISIRTIFVALILPIANTLWAQVKGELELGGFLLGQYRKAVHNELGAPLQRIDTDDGWIYEFHAIKPDTSIYALFKYSVEDTLRVYAIQVNGNSYTDMVPFKGLKLGFDVREVDRVLGNYSRTEKIDNPSVIVRYFEGVNYSVEIDQENKLYGIQIFGNILHEQPKDNFPDIMHFQEAVHSKDVDSLLYWLAPDFEIYAHDKVITYQGSARREFLNANTELMKLLLGDQSSVRAVFEIERAEATPEIRLVEGHRSLVVYKFYNSATLEEIVFTSLAGRWMVYEIKFRK